MNDHVSCFLEAVRNNDAEAIRHLSSDWLAICTGVGTLALDSAIFTSLQNPNIDAFKALVDFIDAVRSNAEKAQHAGNQFCSTFFQIDKMFAEHPDFAKEAILYLFIDGKQTGASLRDRFASVVYVGDVEFAKTLQEIVVKNGININIQDIQEKVYRSGLFKGVRPLCEMGFPPNGNDFRGAIRRLNCELAAAIAEVWDKKDLYYGNWLLEIPCHRPPDVPKAKQMFDMLLDNGANPYRFDDHGIGVLNKQHNQSASEFTEYLRDRGCFSSVADPLVFSAEDIETGNAVRLVSGAAVKGAPLPLFEKIALICNTDIKGLFASLPPYVQEHPGLVAIRQHLDKARAADSSELGDLVKAAKQKPQMLE